MGTKFHISPKTHNAERCGAGNGENARGCPYEGVSPHFSSREEADSYIEQKAASENSEIPSVVVESETLRSKRSLPPLSEEQYMKCSRSVDPVENRKIEDSISMLQNPDRGWSLEKMNSLPHDSDEYRAARVAFNYAYQNERVTEAFKKRENIAWRGKNAKFENQKAAYREQWYKANVELNQANTDFSNVKKERDQALRYFNDVKRSRNRIRALADVHHSDGSFNYRKFSKEEAKRLTERSNLYQALDEKLKKNDDDSLNQAANIHGSQHLIREVKGYTDYRKTSRKEQKIADDLTEKISRTEDPAEKRRLSELREKAVSRMMKAEDMMGQYSKGYRSLVNEVANGKRECDEAFENIMKASKNKN